MKRVRFYSLTLAVCAALVMSKSHAQETVNIGTQVWMTENLNVDKFRNGDSIPQAKTNEEWMAANRNKQPAWCYLGNSPTFGAKYGKLYNWYAVNDARGLAPSGYHVPSKEEWTILEKHLGSDAGTKMRSTSGWITDDPGALKGTDDSGFNGQAGGSRGDTGNFGGIGRRCQWWSSTGSLEIFAYALTLENYRSEVEIDTKDITKGLSVRCLRD
jgi:uncharacterized protein (TIGR02145 family)